MLRNHRPRTGTSPLRVTNRKQGRRCNLCHAFFRPKSLFERYCHRCREGEEILKFVDWLPEAGAPLSRRLSA